MSHPLFRPFQYKGLNLKNRIVMAPMTRGFSPNGIPTDEVAAYYQRRAEGDVGLIISEGTVIDRPSASNNPRYPHFYSEPALKGWQKVIDSVHQAGGVMAPQLWHQGIVKPSTEWQPAAAFEGPSGFVSETEQGGVAMDRAAIEATQAAFVAAAMDAQRLGFDCIELHGAHGYLIDQFFWSGLNKREDIYGGKSIRDRSRFAVEIVEKIRNSVGEDYPIILRISQWKQQNYAARIAETPEEMSEWLQPLADAGVDMFHCSQRRFWEPEFPDSTLNFAGWVKKLTGKPTITVGSVGLSGEFIQSFRGESSQHENFDKLIEALDRGEFDMIAVGRALLSDPQWVQKIRDDRVGELRGFRKEDLTILT